MKKPAANTAPAPPRLVRRKTLRALQNAKIILMVTTPGTQALMFLNYGEDHKNFAMMGLGSASFFLLGGAAYLWERFRRRPPAEVFADAEWVEAPLEKALVRENLLIALLSTVFAVLTLTSVPSLLAGGRADAPWWQWPPAFNTLAVLVANATGWGAYERWRVLYDYARETRSAAAPTVAPQTVPASGVTPVVPVSAPPVIQRNGVTRP